MPLGNPEDITLRALRVLRESQVILCEEFKAARRLLKSIDVDFFQGDFEQRGDLPWLYALNEHTRTDEIEALNEILLMQDRVSVISDCGSPVFEDPGHKALLVAEHYTRHYIPGATSLSAMMMHLPEGVDRFLMEGFLPREDGARLKRLKELSRLKQPFFLMETAYRLKKLSEEIKRDFAGWKLLLGHSLTQKSEKVIEGRIPAVLKETAKLPKGDFVLFLLPA